MEKPNRKYKRLLDGRRKLFFGQGKLESLCDMLQRMNRYYRGRDCIVEKVGKNTVTHTVDDFYSDVLCAAAFLNSRGFQKKHAAIVGENSYNWLVAFLAVSCLGAVAVPIDRELTDSEIAKLCKKADCSAVFFSRTYKNAALECKTDEDFLSVCLNGENCGESVPFGKLILEGGKLLESIKEKESILCAKPGDAAAIVFTSGTTGENKGVVLTHRNFASNVDAALGVIEHVYSAMSVLPMNHTYELSCCVFSALCLNAVLYINDSLRHFQKNLLEFKPEAMAAVPLLMDNIYEQIIKSADAAGKLKKLMKAAKLSRTLLKAGIDIRKPLFSSIRKSFGYRFPMMAVGGAPVNGERARFLAALGFNIYIGYGLTEASPLVAVNDDVLFNCESVGKCVSCTECRILSPDSDGVGELAIRGSNISGGYYSEADATALSFRDGWFLTGDYGRTDKKGNIYISGRKKNLIILDNGKNIYTEVLEAYFTENCPFIREAVVLEHTRRVNGETVKLLALAVSIKEGFFENESDDIMHERVFQEINLLNVKLPAYKRISDVMAVRHEFEKTSTMKIIRKNVEEEYKKYTDLRDKSHA